MRPAALLGEEGGAGLVAQRRALGLVGLGDLVVERREKGRGADRVFGGRAGLGAVEAWLLRPERRGQEQGGGGQKPLHAQAKRAGHGNHLWFEIRPIIAEFGRKITRGPRGGARGPEVARGENPTSCCFRSKKLTGTPPWLRYPPSNGGTISRGIFHETFSNLGGLLGVLACSQPGRRRPNFTPIRQMKTIAPPGFSRSSWAV